MKKINWMLITIFLVLSFPYTANAKSIGIPSDIAYILIDSKTGQVLAEQNADQRLRPASTTKIMTAILALEKGDLSKEMGVSLEAVNDIGRGGMNVGIMAGEKGLTLDHLLHVMLIKSANETANIIAENIAPSRKEFIDWMNAKAKELGANNTNFVNPSGKDTAKEDAAHLTTARDLAAIARHAMAIPEFREIVSTEYYKDMPVTDKHDDWGILRNTNQFLWYDNTYPYSRNSANYKYTVNGVKTGYTVEAGNNLVTSATGEDGMELISVVMHVTQPNKIYGYSKELLRYGFENYSIQTICTAGQSVSNVNVGNAKDGLVNIALLAASDVSSLMPVEEDGQSIETKVSIPEKVVAPVSAGSIIGSVEYRKNGLLLGSTDLKAAQSVEAAPDPGGKTIVPAGSDGKAGSSYSYVLLGILVLLSGLVITRMILRRVSRKMRRKRYEQKYSGSREYD